MGIVTGTPEGGQETATREPRKPEITDYGTLPAVARYAWFLASLVMLRGWALGVAHRHADPRDDARDIVQEAFTAALRDWQVFAPDPTRPAFSALRAWLAGILEKKQLMARRLRRTRGEVPLSTAERSNTEALRHPGHEAQMEARSTLGALQGATTPERWRAAHAAALGFTAAEIAALEGVKVCTIAWRIREARTDFETVTGEARKRARRSR